MESMQKSNRDIDIFNDKQEQQEKLVLKSFMGSIHENIRIPTRHFIFHVPTKGYC